MRVGTGHIEAVVVTGCEAIHRVMLVDLYGHPDARAEELHRITSEMIADVPSPVFQVQRGFGAQLFGDDASVHDVLHRYGPEPDVLLRSMTGDNLLRVFADTVARAGATAYAGRLLPGAAPVRRTAQRRRRPQRRTAGRRRARPPRRPRRRPGVRRPPSRATPWRSPARCRRRRCWSTASTTWPTPSNAPARTDGADGDDPEALRAEAQALAATCGVLRPGQEPHRRGSRRSAGHGVDAPRRSHLGAPTHRSARPGCPTATAWDSSLGCWPHRASR